MKFHVTTGEQEEVALTIKPRTFFRVAVLTVLTIVLLAAIRKAEHALLLIAVAFFLTLALNTPVYWLSRHLPGKRRGSRALATTLSFLFVVLVLGGFLAGIVPPLVRQTEHFAHAAPGLIRQIRSQNSATGKFIRKYHLEKQVDNFSNQLQSRLSNIGGSLFSTATHIASSAFSVLAILALTFMMLVEGPRWVRFARDLIPDGHHALADRLADDMYRVIRGYVNGQVLLAAIASAFIIPMLFILGISYPVALMVVVFICGLIPMVGHTIGAIIVTIVALFHSPEAAVIILIYYITYQQIENYLIQPRIQANSTNMSPLLVFMSVIIGVSFGGIFGGLLAIPVAGCLRIALLEYLRSERIIGGAEFQAATTRPEPPKAETK